MRFQIRTCGVFEPPVAGEGASGPTTIAVTRTKDKEQLVRDLGADEVVADGEALRAAGGADVILATSNSMTSTGDTLKGLRPDGRLILMGLSSTDRLEVPADLLLTRGRIIGSQQNGREYLYEALDYAAKGKVIAETYPLKEIGR